MLMNKKKLLIMIAAAVLAIGVALTLFFILRPTEKPLDSDGDGIPDSEDNEDTDNLDNDYQVNIDDLFK